MFGPFASTNRPVSPERIPPTSRRGSDASVDAAEPAASSSASVQDSNSNSDTDSFARVGRASSRTSPASSRGASPRPTRLDKGKGRAFDASPVDAAFARVQAGEHGPAGNGSRQTQVHADGATAQAEAADVGTSASAAAPAPATASPATGVAAPAGAPHEGPAPATKSRLETLVDGVYERLEATWAAIMALVQHVVGGLAGAYGTAQLGLNTASALFSQAKRATKTAVASQLRRVQGFAAADVEVADGAYARFKARTKASVRNTCSYLLDKLQHAPAAAPAPAATAEGSAETGA